ncbi:MAG: energy transducer TonB [Flavobacteriales bacterium]
MKTQKSSKKEIRDEMETRRSGFFFTGLIAATALTLVAFEWQSGTLKKEYAMGKSVAKHFPDEYVKEFTEPKPKEKPLVQNQQNQTTTIPQIITEITTSTEVEPSEEFEVPSSEEVVTGPSQSGPIVDNSQSVISEYWEDDPEFPGGMEALYKYLSENMKFPKKMQEMGASDRVLVSFVIDKNGEISEVNAVAGKYQESKNEAIRVVSKMPKWKPAKVKNQPVKVRYTIPVSFKFR